MERLKCLLYEYERVILFTLVFGVMLVVYNGIEVMPKLTASLHAPWDPVWHVPLVGAFIVPYLSIYALPVVLFALPHDRPLFRRLSAAVLVTIAVSAIVFFLMPLASPRSAPALSDPFGAAVAWLYRLDAAGNLCPSLHVSTAFLLALAAGQAQPCWRIRMLAWASLIAVSTLFVRQHYCIDIAGGLALAVSLWLVMLRPVCQQDKKFTAG